MLVSIIVPIYNSEKFLDKCLDSIIKQSYKNIEVLLINDGSTDNSRMICEKYVYLDSRFILFNNTNHGVSYSRNFGIEKAKGKYICFVDSDDWIEKDYVSLLKKEFDDNELLDVAVCGYFIEYKGKKYNSNKHDKELTDIYMDVIDDDFIGGYIWNKMYKSNLFEKNIRFDESLKIYEDLDFMLNHICDKNIQYINVHLYHYIQRKNSAIHKAFNDKNSIKSLKKNIDYFVKHNIDPTSLLYKYMLICSGKDKYTSLFYKNNSINDFIKVIIIKKFSFIYNIYISIKHFFRGEKLF